MEENIVNYSGCLNFSKFKLYGIINTTTKPKQQKQLLINSGILGKNKIFLLCSKILVTANHLLGTEEGTVKKSHLLSQNLHSNEREK